MPLPALVRRLEDQFPARGGAPEPPPLPDIELVWERRNRGAKSGWLGYVLAAVGGAALVYGGMAAGWLG